MGRDSRVDDYIAAAAPFARPILTTIRERVHAVIPDAEEAMKWSRPTFLKDGKILLNMAAFKAHASIHFWGAGNDPDGRRLTTLGDLPADLDAQIAEAVARRNEEAPRPKTAPRPVGDLHPAFAAALDAEPRARAAFDGFAPSHRRDYVEWINEAKQEATRERRIAQAVEWLAEGKKRNWKYEAC